MLDHVVSMPAISSRPQSAQDVRVGHRLAVDLGGEQLADEVVARVRLAVRDAPRRRRR